MKPLLIIILAALTACAPELTAPGRPVVLAPAPTPAIKTAPVTDSTARIGQSVDKASTQAQATSTALEKASKAAADATAIPSDNIALRAALDQVVASLAAARSSNGELLKEMDTLKHERDTLSISLEGLTASIEAKEAEVTVLRQSLKQANQDLAANAVTIEKLNKSNASLLKTSASAGVYRAWVIGAVVILILIIAIKSALKFYRIPIP
jgi:hypothetical protein